MKGYTLIELVIFITIVAISISILIPIATTSQRMVTLTPLTKAQQLAQARMELILGQRYIVGFPNYSDPCNGGSPPSMCTPPTGFTVSSTINNNWNGDTDYNVITVVVSGDGSATLTTLVSDYNEYE